jgi:hypothetical protein
MPIAFLPVPVAVRSEATALIAETVGSIPASGMDACTRLFIIIQFAP